METWGGQSWCLSGIVMMVDSERRSRSLPRAIARATSCLELSDSERRTISATRQQCWAWHVDGAVQNKSCALHTNAQRRCELPAFHEGAAWGR
jgi:hypothetical protein